MAEVSRFWGGTVTGDCGPYSNDEYNFIFYTLMGDGKDGAAVAVGYANMLAVSGVGSPLSVNTGAALVGGIFYESTAVETITFANASAGNSRIDVVVLRASWALQTVRLALLAGTQTAGTPVATALTQTMGLTYEAPLAHATINSSGLVLLEDKRVYAQMATMAKPIIAAILF